MAAATQTQQQPAATTQAKPPLNLSESDYGKLLDSMVDKATMGEKTRIIVDSLSKRIETLEQLLPDPMKNQAARFIKRAALYFTSNGPLSACTTSSFMTCVLKAAELGLAIDGRLAHAVPFNNKKKDPQTGAETWVKEAQFQVDYKGLLAVCRRSGIVKDCYAKHVYSGDEFVAYEEDDECHLLHKVNYSQADRGTLLGVYAKIILSNRTWRFEYMTVDEVNKIKARSKSKDKGPWVTDELEMQKKTVIKRALKIYCDDPVIGAVLENDDADFDTGETVKTEAANGRIAALEAKISGLGRTAPVAPSAEPELPQDDAMTPQESFDFWAKEIAECADEQALRAVAEKVQDDAVLLGAESVAKLMDLADARLAEMKK